MKHLIIYSHPFEGSFCNAIMQSYQESLIENHHQVKIRNLYAIEFNPVLNSSELLNLEKGIISPDVRLEQEYIEWADVVNFIYPMWWSGMPAILKGYIERVFCEGFAYRLTENGSMGLLTDKKVFILSTMGNTELYSEQHGILEAIKIIEDNSIFEYCGMEVIKHKFIDGITYATYDERLKILEHVRKMVPRFF